METQKNSKKWVYVIVAVLGVILLCLGGLFAYKELIEKKDKNDTQENKEDNKLTRSSDIVKKYCNLGFVHCDGLYNLTSNSVSSEYAWFDYIYGDKIFSKDKLLNSDLDNVTKIVVSYNNLGNAEYYTEQQVKDECVKIFGNYTRVEDIEKSGASIVFDKENSRYVTSIWGIGNNDISNAEVKFESAYIENNELKINVRVLFNKCNGEADGNIKCIYYSDYARTNAVDYDINDSKAPIYTYTFVKDTNDNYIFDSIKKTK